MLVGREGVIGEKVMKGYSIRHPEARKAGREDPVLRDQQKTFVERFLDGRVATSRFSP